MGYCPFLMNHPFFNRYIKECPQVMRKVCHSSMGHLNFSKGDIVFHPGEALKEPKMYFVSYGTLKYLTSGSSEPPTNVTTHEWVAEATLWTEWMHQGTFYSESDCQLCVLDAFAF